MYKILFLCLFSWNLSLIKSDDTTTTTVTTTKTTISTTTDSPITDPNKTPTTPTSTDAGNPGTTTKVTDETTPQATDTTTTATTEATTTTPTTPTTTTTTPTTTPTTTTTVPPTPETIQATSFKWTGSDVEDAKSVIFRVDPGYFISVTVSNVSMADGNFLLIMGGDSYRADATDGRVFANTVKGPWKYIFKTDSVFAYCENGNGGDYKFAVEFEQTGEVTTTVFTSTTTPIPVPPTEPSDSVYITVNVTGRYPSDYDKAENVEAFKQCVVTMASTYCKDQDIKLTQDITNKYVMISDLSHCPYTWPNSIQCVQITFKLPIFYNETHWQGYQLTTQHLEAMWSRWDSLDDGCLKKNAFEVYVEPNVERSIMWWAIGIALVIIAFVVFLWFIRTCSSKFKTALKKSKNQDDDDTKSIISNKKESVASLQPHYLQDHLSTPKLFEN